MKNLKWLVAAMTILSLTGMFSGCAQPPEAERSAAKMAMDAALSAHADKYATAEFDAARKIWDASEVQMKEKKYQEAKQGYSDAKGAFEKSAGSVEAGKKAFTDQAVAAVAGIEEGWKQLEAAAKKFENKIEKKGLWESDVKTFREGLKAAQDMVGTDPAGATAKAGQLKMFLVSYGAIFKQTAAAPVKPQKSGKRARDKE